jgi:metal-sulfur cluster biosynthetic enzyme
MQTQTPFSYDGPEALYRPIVDALMQVMDPEFALSVVDVGLIYGVTITEDKCQVRMTMTSAACPLANLIVEDIQEQLGRIAPAQFPIDVQLLWEPPWTAARLSEHAKRFLGW